MRVIAGTQNHRLLTRTDMIKMDKEDYVLPLAIDPKEIDDSEAVDIELNAGDVSIHNPLIIHGSNSNESDKWRIGLTLRYISTTTLVEKEHHENILLRGNASPAIKNVYAKRPVFLDGDHMPFRRHEMYK